MGTKESRLRVTPLGGGVHRVEFVDRNILDEANIQQINDEIVGLVDGAEEPKLLISFANVDHLSSAALGTLITVHNRVKQRGGQLRLSNIDPQIYEVFTITKLHKLFEIHDTDDDALASLP